MPGPFPGMDPYMELRWGDSSARLIVYAADALNNRLLPDDCFILVEGTSCPTTSGSVCATCDFRPAS